MALAVRNVRNVCDACNVCNAPERGPRSLVWRSPCVTYVTCVMHVTYVTHLNVNHGVSYGARRARVLKERVGA